MTLPWVDVAAHGAATLAAFGYELPDAEQVIDVVALDSLGSPLGAPREILRSGAYILNGLRVLWAGYSFAVSFVSDPMSASPGVSLLRVCP